MPSSAAILTTLLALSQSTDAFQVHNNHGAVKTMSTRQHKTFLSMTDTQSEVEKLRAAAAKAREEYERLSKEMGKEITSSGDVADARATQVAPKNLSVDQVKSIAADIDFSSGDANSQTTALDKLVQTGDFSLWKSAVRRAGSDMSMLVPFPVSLGNLESRTDGKVTGESLGVGGEGDVKFEDFQDLTVAVVLGSTLLGILSLAVLPPNVGATFTYLFALIPIGFIGIGSTSPGIIAAAIVGARSTKEDDETRRERICRHEAGHFLCGYMCGLPVKEYSISPDTGVACVEFHTSSTSVAGRELGDDEISALSVVAMSGSVAEIMEYGKAKGGENDLLELQNCFAKSKEFIGAAKQQEITRWGALTSYGLIKANLNKYEGLVNAFKANKSLSDCVAIIEGSA
ncbi:hypothetical protein QTG54_016208 [Skeletonema marinoi]|uniref:Peptidase M41 domain-containing protein n=1 Tax=Skeletonema marinoi TaxID=267567 RepID=A0AAD8XT97_9STRA|nr:hypothetical protein QTG54_016208 [Skeletonema marinoi]|mmetsp:Transcript_4549/g.9437  ORF Transcript_4549/g.9437 Transcript_4549/m.9437 type:complete len:401 (+) Transcript_4549:100-1302(+)